MLFRLADAMQYPFIGEPWIARRIAAHECKRPPYGNSSQRTGYVCIVAPPSVLDDPFGEVMQTGGVAVYDAVSVPHLLQMVPETGRIIRSLQTAHGHGCDGLHKGNAVKRCKVNNEPFGTGRLEGAAPVRFAVERTDRTHKRRMCAVWFCSRYVSGSGQSQTEDDADESVAARMHQCMGCVQVAVWYNFHAEYTGAA